MFPCKLFWLPTLRVMTCMSCLNSYRLPIEECVGFTIRFHSGMNKIIITTNQSMRKLKIFNGGDWDHQGGHLFVAAHSLQDASNLISEAYRKIRGLQDRTDIRIMPVNFLRVYWAKDCWGNAMDGITPERGVWWGEKQWTGQ